MPKRAKSPNHALRRAPTHCWRLALHARAQATRARRAAQALQQHLPRPACRAQQARGVAQCARRVPQAVAWAARAVCGRPQRRLPRPRAATRSADAPCALRLWRLCLPSSSRPCPCQVGAAPVCARPEPRLASSLFGHFPQSCRLWLCSVRRALASVVANVALEPVKDTVTSLTRCGENHSDAPQWFNVGNNASNEFHSALRLPCCAALCLMSGR